ncbi:hypothetical protein GW891_00945 [bacterium]|nr:hypothetical protein [bacterium]
MLAFIVCPFQQFIVYVVALVQEQETLLFNGLAHINGLILKLLHTGVVTILIG